MTADCKSATVTMSVGAETSREAARYAEAAEKAGADAVMAIPPVATPLSADGKIAYYRTIHDALSIPLVVQDASGYMGGEKLTVETMARLRNDLWQLDVPVRNAGSLSALCCRGAAGGSARLRLSGGRRLATALRQAGEEVFRVRSDGDDPAPPLGMLEGGQEVTVRLLVEAAEGSSLELEVEAPRSGRDRRTVELR